jgi:gas vesicle protein
MSTTKFFAGALVGLVAGLLLAPQKGEDLREELVDTADKWKKKLDKITGKASNELNDLREILEDEVSGLADDARLRILSILREAEDGAMSMKQTIASELR